MYKAKRVLELLRKLPKGILPVLALNDLFAPLTPFHSQALQWFQEHEGAEISWPVPMGGEEGLAANLLGGFCQSFVGVGYIQKRTLRGGVGGNVGKSACFCCSFSPAVRGRLFKLGQGLVQLEQLPPAVIDKHIHLLLWR